MSANSVQADSKLATSTRLTGLKCELKDLGTRLSEHPGISDSQRSLLNRGLTELGFCINALKNRDPWESVYNCAQAVETLIPAKSILTSKVEELVGRIATIATLGPCASSLHLPGSFQEHCLEYCRQAVYEHECLEEYNDQDPQESIREAHEYLDSYKPDMRSDREDGEGIQGALNLLEDLHEAQQALIQAKSQRQEIARSLLSKLTAHTSLVNISHLRRDVLEWQSSLEKQLSEVQ